LAFFDVINARYRLSSPLCFIGDDIGIAATAKTSFAARNHHIVSVYYVIVGRSFGAETETCSSGERAWNGDDYSAVAKV